jgi:hypothetical protein
MDVFARMMEGLAAEAAVPKTVMIDATYLKALSVGIQHWEGKAPWRSSASWPKTSTWSGTNT